MPLRSVGVRRCFCLLLVMLFCTTLTVGCGSSTSKVKGKVTYNGKPVVWGTVTLIPTDGGATQQHIDLEGNFEIDGVPVGEVLIAVISPNPNTGDRTPRGGKPGKAATVTKGGKASSESDDPREKLGIKQTIVAELPKPPPGAWFPIPEKYSDPLRSGLKDKITPKETILKIDLK